MILRLKDCVRRYPQFPVKPEQVIVARFLILNGHEKAECDLYDFRFHSESQSVFPIFGP